MSILDTVYHVSYMPDQRYLYIANKFGVSPLCGMDENLRDELRYINMYRIFGRFVPPGEMSNIAFVTLWDDRFTVIAHGVEWIGTVNGRAPLYACGDDIFTREYQNVDLIGPMSVRYEDEDTWREYYAGSKHIATAKFWVDELDERE